MEDEANMLNVKLKHISPMTDCAWKPYTTSLPLNVTEEKDTFKTRALYH
jgi:hypothetical protein